LIIIAIKVHRIAERIDNKIVFNDIEKNCSLKKLVLNLNDQFKISSKGKIKPINIGIKHIKKHTKDPIELNLFTCVGLKFDPRVE
tara:strand:+ start:831 stop:1085 length:255 start_codon:yes stop_codon:yes gene_type:complete